MCMTQTLYEFVRIQLYIIHLRILKFILNIYLLKTDFNLSHIFNFFLLGIP